MSEYATALSVIQHELGFGEDILDALDLAAQVVRDDRAMLTPVNLRKPVSLVKRPRSGDRWFLYADLMFGPAPVDYVKYVGRHAAPYHPENETWNNAMCTADNYFGGHYGDTHVETADCPACRPETYPAQHAYQIDMF